MLLYIAIKEVITVVLLKIQVFWDAVFTSIEFHFEGL